MSIENMLAHYLKIVYKKQKYINLLLRFRNKFCPFVSCLNFLVIFGAI